MVFFMGSENKGNPAGGDDRNTRTTYSAIELIAEIAVELLGLIALGLQRFKQANARG